MIHAEHERRTRDGLTLHVQTWRPDRPPKLVVAIVHGGSEHAGRYGHVAEDLGAIGALVIGADHRGQGQSGGRRGDVTSFSAYTSDLGLVLESFAAELPAAERPDAIPWFLFGHSMGGLIGLLYLAEHAKALPLRGAVISSPLFELTVRVPTLKVWLARAAARLVPTMPLKATIPPGDVCRDAEVARQYATDPYRADVVTARWYQAMLRACDRGRAVVPRLTSPMLWYYGTDDRLISTRAVDAAFASLADAPGNDQTLQRYPGYFHELHNEPAAERSIVIGAICNWLVARLPAA